MDYRLFSCDSECGATLRKAVSSFQRGHRKLHNSAYGGSGSDPLHSPASQESNSCAKHQPLHCSRIVKGRIHLKKTHTKVKTFHFQCGVLSFCAFFWGAPLLGNSNPFPFRGKRRAGGLAWDGVCGPVEFVRNRAKLHVFHSITFARDEDRV